MVCSFLGHGLGISLFFKDMQGTSFRRAFSHRGTGITKLTALLQEFYSVADFFDFSVDVL